MLHQVTMVSACAVVFLICFFPCTSAVGAAAPAVDCSSLVLTMADCLSFVSNGSAVEKPEGTCCSGLKTVLKTDAECICEAFRNSAQLGVILNVTKAMALPDACKVSATSATNCKLSAAPASSPDSSSTAVSPSPDEQQLADDEVSSPSPSPVQGVSSASVHLMVSYACVQIFSPLISLLVF